MNCVTNAPLNHCPYAVIFLFSQIIIFQICITEAQLNNSIIGDPFVSCAADAIYAKWKTNEAFVGGHVNVRYTPNRYCYQVLVTNNQIELLVPHLDCSLNRLRVLDPSPGLVIEATILISFHDQFVTAGDRLFILRCFYSRHLNRNSQNVTNEGAHISLIVLPNDNRNESFAVSPNVTQTSEKPLRCSYVIKQEVKSSKKELIKSGKSTGIEFARRARRELSHETEVPENVQLKPIEGRLTIGTKLYHNWTCENARATQCLVITNCVLRTQDTEHKLIDDRGCSLVPTLVPELRYNGQHNAEQIMQLFSTIDQSFVHYQCQLNLVEYNSSSGDVNVPFSCPFPECKNRDIITTLRKQRKIAIEQLPQATEVLDVISQRIDIVSFGDESVSDVVFSNSNNYDEQSTQSVPDDRTEICMRKSLFIMSMIGIVLISFSTIVCASRDLLRRNRIRRSCSI